MIAVLQILSAFVSLHRTQSTLVAVHCTRGHTGLTLLGQADTAERLCCPLVHQILRAESQSPAIAFSCAVLLSVPSVLFRVF